MFNRATFPRTLWLCQWQHLTILASFPVCDTRARDMQPENEAMTIPLWKWGTLLTKTKSLVQQMSHLHQQLLQCKLILTPDVPWWDYLTHHHTTTLRSWGQLCTSNHITIISIGSHAELWITTAHYAFPQMPCLISCVSVTERYGEGLLYISCKKGMGLCVYDGAASSALKQLACKNHCYKWLQCITCHQWPNRLIPRLLGG